jgi:hypothetical protein
MNEVWVPFARMQRPTTWEDVLYQLKGMAQWHGKATEQRNGGGTCEDAGQKRNSKGLIKDSEPITKHTI